MEVVLDWNWRLFVLFVLCIFSQLRIGELALDRRKKKYFNTAVSFMVLYHVLLVIAIFVLPRVF